MIISEVNQLRRRIELECQAAYRVLHDTAINAPHAFINARMANIQAHKERLAMLIGDKQSMELMIEVFEAIDEKAER